ncbi:Cupredoxin [Dichotomocladium elegans]|nr:Cupredoxin [Dichotomocladium elegans]
MKLFLSILLFAAGVVSAARVEYWWNITYATANPDGLFERRVIGVNGTWPPPAVHATINDTLVIHTYNGLDKPTTLHAHGMFQNGTVWMDGPSMTTQCPIPPGYTFDYEFNITQHGTYWIHSHYMSQYMDGLRSPLILHNSPEEYTYDEDQIVTLSDWYHEEAAVNVAKFMSVYNPTGAEPVPQSGLINDNVNTTFSFQPGKTYRLRLINVSGFAMFYFSIDGHTLEVIEIDGVTTTRTPVQSVYLTAAQRVSVLVTAKNTTDTNYYVHADMNTDMFDQLPSDLQYNLVAPLYYDRSHNNFAPSEDVGMNSTFEDLTLTPLVPMPAVDPDFQLILSFNFDVTTDGINRGMFNNLPYLSPLVPTLHTLFSEGELALQPEVYGPQTITTIFKHLDMVELVVNNLDSGEHPFHLHGHIFQLVARGPGAYLGGNVTNATWSLENPARRDTVTVAAESFIIVRFRADNPGVWLFHCHIDWHMDSGLVATFISAPDVVQKTMTLPQAMIDMCEAGGIPARGNAAGKSGLDLKGAPSGVTLIYDGFTARGKGAMAGCILAALIGIGTIVWFSIADPEKKAKEILAAAAAARE